MANLQRGSAHAGGREIIRPPPVAIIRLLALVNNLEQILSIQSQFCFSDGETIHAKGGEADVYPSDEAA